MNKLVDRLRAAGIFNTHELLTKFAQRGWDVACSYRKGDMRGECNKTTVYSPSHHTNPDAAWYDHGRKAFLGNKAESMPKAMAWASEIYGIKDWATDPTDRNSAIPKEVREAAMKFLREHEKQIHQLSQ